MAGSLLAGAENDFFGLLSVNKYQIKILLRECLVVVVMVVGEYSVCHRELFLYPEWEVSGCSVGSGSGGGGGGSGGAGGLAESIVCFRSYSYTQSGKCVVVVAVVVAVVSGVQCLP